MVLMAKGDRDRAQAEYRSAIEIWTAALGPEHPHVATARNNLAIVLNELGKRDESEEQYRLAIASWTKSLGAEHVNVANARNNLAGLLQAQGKLEEAEVEFRESMALWVAARGADHPHVAVAHYNLADLLLEQERFAEALPLAERAWEHLRRDDAAAAYRAAAAFGLARALWGTGGDPSTRARAIELAERAIEAYQAAEDTAAVDKTRQWLARRRAP